ncbi:MAG: TIGR01459 family HAD-type hydrolase [Alphaproteobacteria bacterium]|nr:TIGR01459 family HAD-type hydrolase [Alphaproteobacteria bacterium]MBF0128415.1 TIGR01459 family HAD-type hydrolase [Alphaproteobacteria bacterium]
MLPGFAPLAERYDAFILDLWGVIHDGSRAYPHAVATLERLRGTGKPTVLLSNAPRRGHALVQGMEAMGIPRRLYGDILSSGEAVNRELRLRRDPFYAALGPLCYHLGPERDRSIFDDVRVTLVAEVNAASFIVNTGPREFSETVDDYEHILQACAARSLPMVCANPDRVVIREGKRLVCAGALADRYIALGGRVSQRGKPDPAVYDLCLEMLNAPDRRRVLTVGDAMETDIAGATAAGIDSVLVTGGIHAEELGVAYGEPASPVAVAALARRFGLGPAAAIPAFIW